MGDMVAFGDLNYDGQDDAAVILGVNTGGTGVFTSIAAVLNIGGAPVHTALVYIDDRPIIADLMTIVSGEIIAQMTIHGADDPMCCPSFQTQQAFRFICQPVGLDTPRHLVRRDAARHQHQLPG
jgi:hypothetical protein